MSILKSLFGKKPQSSNAATAVQIAPSDRATLTDVCGTTSGTHAWGEVTEKDVSDLGMIGPDGEAEALFTRTCSNCKKEEVVRSVYKQRRGGFEEPYCSKQCYDDAGRYAFTLQRQKANGVCGMCQSPVTVSISGGGIPHEGKTLYVCPACTKKIGNYFKAYKNCCMCQKSLS